MTDIDLSALAAARDGSQPLRGYLSTPRTVARNAVNERLGADVAQSPVATMAHRSCINLPSCALI
jgi:hypothetical protein